MPNYTRGSTPFDAYNRDHDYDYPEKLDLKPGKKLHEFLTKLVYDRAVISKGKMAEREDAWDATDQTLQAYIDLSVSEKALKKSNPNAPVSIVVPYSYAALETIMTYMTMAFINQSPIFQYDSVSAEDTVPNKLMEIVVARQVEFYKAALSLYIWMKDGLAYGIGAIAPVWKTEIRPVRRTRTKLVETLGGTTEETEETSEPEIAFEGTELVSIGPRYLLLDPNSAPHTIQGSEYVGWIEETNIQRLLTLEKGQPDVWFNAKYVKDCGYKTSVFTVSGNSRMTGDSGDVLFPITLVHMYVNIIPKDMELPPGPDNKDGYYPEKWLFTIANDWTLVRAVRVDSQHGKFPIAINAPDFDGYSTYPMARLEISNGLQTTLNWLFNSHIANVRKVVNNTLVVDPMLVDMEDIKSSREGGIIRLQRSAWGKGVKDAVFQLGVTDVTRNHMADTEIVINLMQRLLASTDNMMGLARRGGERVSATESRNVSLAANSRVEKLARIISIQGMQDLGYFMATNVQDYMSKELQLKVLGNWPTELINTYGLNKTVNITPNELNVPFDTIVRDGTLSIDTSGVTQNWIQLYQTVAANPLLMKQFDMVRIFKYIGQLMGAKNLSDFQISGNVMMDDQVSEEAKKGNMVPVGALS